MRDRTWKGKGVSDEVTTNGADWRRRLTAPKTSNLGNGQADDDYISNVNQFS